MTVNQQVMERSWNEVKGKVRERWGQLSDNELEEARGDVERLIGLIQQKTGEARGEVESYVEAIAKNGTSVVSRAKESILHQTHQVAEAAQHAAGRVADTARTGYEQSTEMVRHRPVESLAVCFGAGLITGVVVGLLTCRK